MSSALQELLEEEYPDYFSGENIERMKKEDDSNGKNIEEFR